MSLVDIPDDRVLALLRSGCRTRQDLGAELGVLSTSVRLDEAIVRLQQRGLVTVTDAGELVPTFEQPALDEEASHG